MSEKRRLRAGAASLLVAPLFFLSAFGASADVVNSYVFAPGSTTVLKGDTEAISGSFTFDSTLNIESSVSIILTGPAPYAGDYIETVPVSTGSSEYVFAEIGGGGSGGDLFGILFADPLNVSPDDFSVTLSEVPNTPNDSSPQGAAIFAPSSNVSAPEPISLSIFGAGLAAVAAMRRRKAKSA